MDVAGTNGSMTPETIPYRLESKTIGSWGRVRLRLLQRLKASSGEKFAAAQYEATAETLRKGLFRSSVEILSLQPPSAVGCS